MGDTQDKSGVWKHRIGRELFEYSLNFVYLACLFGVFTWYKRLILASYEIVYLDYGISLIQAAVLAKVIMIGQVLGLGRRLEEKPLIVPILHKTVVFLLWVGFFSFIEHTIRGLIRGRGPAEGFHELAAGGGYELLAKCLVMLFAFIPFFALKELRRVLGADRMRELFFKPRAAWGQPPPGSTGPKEP